MKNILSVTNCQGPVLFSRFLAKGCPTFDDKYAYLRAVQVHTLKEKDRTKVRKRYNEADVVVAHPLAKNVVFMTQLPNLTRKCAEDGKELHLIPALHFSAQFATEGRQSWPAAYPFGQTEDKMLLALYQRGLSAEDACKAYHEEQFCTEQELEDQVEQALDQFRSREEKFDYAFKISDFYADNWRKHRLHFVKSHPTPVVYEEMARRLAKVLDLPEPDASLLGEARGNDQFALPIKTWVKETMGMTFEDDPDTALFKRERIPFVDLVRVFWDFYASQNVTRD